MFKKLRNRMLLVNTVLLGLVLILSFAAFFIINYLSIQNEISKKLEEIFSASLRNFNNEREEGEFTFQSISLRSGNVPCFTLSIDENDELIGLTGVFDLGYDEYYKVFEMFKTPSEDSPAISVRGIPEGKITIDGRRWQYSEWSYSWYSPDSVSSSQALSPQGVYVYTEEISNSHTIRCVSFMEITEYEARLSQLLVTLIIIISVALAALFAVVYFTTNRAIRPVEESWLKQKRFIADASHELKTPIAVISTNLDALETSKEETVGSQKEWLSYIRTELSRMGKLTGDMLYLAESEETKTEQAPFDLNLTCETAVASIEAMLYEKKINLQTEIGKDITVRGDKERIQQAVLILLDNAAKYTDDEGNILIALKKLKGQAVLTFKNSGKGIPQEDLPKIFDRFYRPDASRSEESGGYGLGLSIAKTIVERAGGEITGQSAEGFTTFTITLKLV